MVKVSVRVSVRVKVRVRVKVGVKVKVRVRVRRIQVRSRGFVFRRSFHSESRLGTNSSVMTQSNGIERSIFGPIPTVRGIILSRAVVVGLQYTVYERRIFGLFGFG